MTAPILLEGRNLAVREGTGISSYARNLAEVLRDLGYELDVVFDTEFPVARNNPEWNEIRLYDRAGRERISPIRSRYTKVKHYLANFPRAVTAHEVGSGFTADASIFPGLGGFRRRQAAELLFWRADQHLLRYGKRLTLKPLRQPALFHATHPASVQVKGCPNIYTIHDLVPLRLPHTTLDNKRAMLEGLKVLARTADKIVTVSEFSRQDIIRFLGVEEDRVVNTHQAVSLPARYLDRSRDDTQREVASFGLRPQRYFLFVSALEPKKNLERLVDAFISARSNHPLVIVGKLGWGYEKLLKKLEMVRPMALRGGGQMDRIIYLSYLPFNQVMSLMANARALLFPSIYEGFGLPALEAMSLGTPVLSSNAASLPEVVGEAGLLVDPYDTVAMAEAIRALDSDADLREELSRRGPDQARIFSPERYRERIDALYKELL
ncbi:glycosyltransferase family 4 protein [Lutibaculum baratangense]|uniref:Glycosyl transferase, group 1 n=1 Tax=Lutibaculum baratangense AMV1 TaxID=631454 RepID=V4RB46_9HYPH|nr:glycosyltransferase family 1 protein [Lutibaculum baratangense]ESR22629.1 glycosyl transferase, group 1 [Lutibaculum baratangense AMV1]